jgi:P-type Cu+ transporter
MHREIKHSERPFYTESPLSLYLLTALVGVLIAADLWPLVADWLASQQVELPAWARWQRAFYGYRFALLAAVLGGARVLFTSLESLLEGRLGADLALALACIAAILMGEPLVAAEVVFIGMVGECLEGFTFGRTQRAIRRIVEVCPRRCWLLRDGQEVRVLTSEVKVGDHVRVKPGGRVPVDGVVVDGRSALDESALTGESLPVDKGQGDEVLAGSLNQHGALTIEARRVAEQTVVGRVIELTARALQDKVRLERTADRLARAFLPVVLGLAALTFLVGLGYRSLSGRVGIVEVTRSAYPALAVLVVACPCALILATPAAIIAALGRLAGTGVLIKGGSALERLAEVEVFAFDKTGTLTAGRLELGDVIGLDGTPPDEVVRVAATAEQRSEHLFAGLILQEATRRGLTPEPVEEFTAHPGAGITVRSGGASLLVGNQRLFEEQGYALPAPVLDVLRQLDARGQTALLVGRNGAVIGVIGAHDRVREEAPALVAELRANGIRDIVLLTGDRRAVAAAVAAQVGITTFHAELLPQQKAERITQLRQPEPNVPVRRVAMVGDGINDAPALACADAGLALGGTGTDVAAEAGDVVLMGDPLRPLPLLLRLSRETVRVIRQNILIFAFGVNAVGIVLTAWLWPLLAPSAQWYEQAPLAAVVYHQLGSLAVLLNAMRLLWFERTAPAAEDSRFRDALRRVDEWIGRYLNVDEILHGISHHARAVLLGGGSLVLLLWLLSGLTQVGPDEIAVVRRFGRPLEQDLGPGLSWRWPWPVERVDRVQPERVQTLEIGFRTGSGTAGEAGLRTWATAHQGDGLRRVSDESVMMTGDGNLVELQATVQFRIDNPRVYLFDVADAPGVLRAATETVLREAVAGQPFLELLTVRREEFQRDALARLRDRCRDYGEHGLGVRVEGLSLHEVHPPQEVVAAYHDVARAMEARDRLINEAVAEATRKKRAAEGQALVVVREAQSAALERVRQAEVLRDGFLVRYASRSQLDLDDEWEIIDAAVPLAPPESEAALADYARRRQELIDARRTVADARLSWEALTEALRGRDKVIVDAERLPGRRQLLLVDPELFRSPVPMLGMPDRAPRTRRPQPEEGP